MKSRNIFLAIASLLGLLFGLSFVFVPAQTMTNYGVTLGPGGQWMSRYLGAAYIGLAVITWLARRIQPGQAMQAILLGNFVLSVISFAIAILFVMSGTGNALLWSDAVFYLFLALGFGYFSFVKQGNS